MASHPWLTFQLDLRRAPFSLWTSLGAAQSKCAHIARTLLPPDVSAELYRIYLAKGVMATTAIEGNTLSEQEVLEIVQGRDHLRKSQEYQAREVRNIIDACNWIVADILAGQSPDVSFKRIQNFNRKVLESLKLDDGVVPGEVRRHSVTVGRYRGAPSEDCKYLLDKLCIWINQQIQPPNPELTVAFGIVRAVMAHLYLAWIHPFGDGNGRTARLVELQILMASGVPAPAAHLLSNHYNQTRQEYYRQLDRASKIGGDVLPFLEYAIQGFGEGLDEQISRIDQHHWRATWKEFVYSAFQDRVGPTARRQRQVALDLWAFQFEPLEISKIPTMTPEVARLYAVVGKRTLARDLNELERLGIIQQDRHSARINGQTVLRWLPKVKTT